MKRVARWKNLCFVGGLVALAFVIIKRNDHKVVNVGPSAMDRVLSEAQRANESKLALKKAEADEKAATRANFLARNVNPGFTRGAFPKVAVVSVTANKTLNSPLTSQLIRRLSTNSIELVGSYFTPEFISDGNFSSLANGSSQFISSLELTNSLDGLVIAKESVRYEQTPSLENLFTASVDLEVSIIRFADHNERQTFSWNANGPGFRENDALRAAEERLFKKISQDTNFSIVPIRRLF